MNIRIRQESPKDQQIVERLIEEAFREMAMSDHKEHLLVARLRKSDSFVPDLSLVAEEDAQIVGHILLTKINIRDGEKVSGSLALAPVSVSPAYQNRGIGSKLVIAAHKQAKALGFTSIVLLGHKDYYPRFGYELSSNYGIKLPFEATEENCMVVVLCEHGLAGVKGMVEYPMAFYE